MRKKISEIRRRELAESAFLTLQEYGFKGTTIQRVSERAGMSHGLVHHYFKSKDDLLEAAVRLTNERITADVLRLLKLSRTPRERLTAVIEGNFAPSVFSREVAQGWAACCGEAAFDERFGRILRMIGRRLRTNLLFDLKKLLPASRAETVASGIAMMIDGAWLKCAFSQGPSDREAIMAPIFQWLTCELAMATPASGEIATDRLPDTVPPAMVSRL